MESKKLPVLWVPVGYDCPDVPIVQCRESDEDRSAAASFRDGICQWTVEPYIPAARVRDALRRIDELLVIQSSCRETTKPEFIREFDTMMSCTKDTRKELAALIADVEEHEG